MNKKYLLLLILLAPYLIKAQIDIDISTGQSPMLGDPDANWVQRVAPGGPDFITYSVSALTGISTVIHPCSSNWISPNGVNTGVATASNSIAHGYRYYFNVDNNCGTLTEATMNFDFLDTDEQILQIRVNPGPGAFRIFRNVTIGNPPLLPPTPINNIDLLTLVGANPHPAVGTGTNVFKRY